MSARAHREERGQMALFGAMFMVLVLIVGGMTVDYGIVYLGAARFRHAMDQAALAGTNELQRNPGGGTAAAQAVVVDFMSKHGYVDDANTDIVVTFGSSPSGQTVTVDGTLRRRTFFLQMIGVNEVSLGSSVTATAGGNPIDVVLSVDTTGSMGDVPTELKNAVAAFVDQLSPSASMTSGPKVSLAVFAGRVAPSRGQPPTLRDAQVATYLTYDKALLDRMADNTGATPCPTGWPSQPSFVTTSNAPRPIDRVCPVHPNGGSGTFIGNGFQIALDPSQSWSLYSTARGGRTQAKKVLVMITDGENNVSGVTQSQLNTETRTAAANARAGEDGITGTADDVEIFTVGLFGSSESNFDTNPPKCPAAAIPAGPSVVDQLLIDASSSAAGSCDHYFALNKAQASQLPALFVTIAGRILRSRLTN